MLSPPSRSKQHTGGFSNHRRRRPAIAFSMPKGIGNWEFKQQKMLQPQTTNRTLTRARNCSINSLVTHPLTF
jgi:hypothetical protein